MHETITKEIENSETADAQHLAISQELTQATGALEAVGDYIAGGDPYELPEHQERLVEAIRTHNGAHRRKMVAVFDLKEANEGFVQVLDSIGRRAIRSMVELIPKQLSHTAASLKQYDKLAQTTLRRLRQLRPALVNAEQSRSATDVFSAGAYKRFFQSGGKEIASFEEFQKTFSRQCALANHGFVHGIGFSTFIADRIIKDLEKLQNPNSNDLREDLKKSIAFHWGNVWRDGFKTDTPGTVPRAFFSDHSDCKAYAICALFDARTVVATEPRKSRDVASAGKYRAALAFDKNSEVKPSGEIELPSADQVLPVVDKAISLLNDMNYYRELAQKCEKLTKVFAQTSKATADALDGKLNPYMLDGVIAYMQLVSACSQLLTAPHTELAWMHVRSCLVVAAMAEQVTGTDEKDLIVTKRFFSKQNESFASALESYVETSAILAAVVSQMPDKA